MLQGYTTDKKVLWMEDYSLQRFIQRITNIKMSSFELNPSEMKGIVICVIGNLHKEQITVCIWKNIMQEIKETLRFETNSPESF